MNTRYNSVSSQEIMPSTTKTANFTADRTIDVESAAVVEVWMTIENAGGTDENLDIDIETSEDGTNFIVAKQILGVTGNGPFTAILARGLDTLGKFLRVKGTITGTTPTFDVKLIGLVGE